MSLSAQFLRDQRMSGFLHTIVEKRIAGDSLSGEERFIELSAQSMGIPIRLV